MPSFQNQQRTNDVAPSPLLLPPRPLESGAFSHLFSQFVARRFLCMNGRTELLLFDSTQYIKSNPNLEASDTEYTVGMPLFLVTDGVALQMPLLQKFGVSGPSKEISYAVAHFWWKGSNKNDEYRAILNYAQLTVAHCSRDYEQSGGKLVILSVRTFREMGRGSFPIKYFQGPGRYIGGGTVEEIGTFCFLKQSAFSEPYGDNQGICSDLVSGYLLQEDVWHPVFISSARTNSPGAGDVRLTTEFGEFQFFGDDSAGESVFAPKTGKARFKEILLDQLRGEGPKSYDQKLVEAFASLGVLSPWPPAPWWG